MLHLALLVALAGAPDVLAFKLDRPAQDLEECRWAAAASDGEQKVEERRVQATDRVLVPVPTGRKLADFAGWVVVVTRLDLADRVALTGRLASLYDLAVANEDRQLFVLALGAEADSEELEQQWRTAGVPGALGFVKEHTLYADPARGAKSTFVVGRSGELVWLGDPSKDEKGFVAALDIALDRRPAPRITPPSVDALGPALVDYYAGRFDKARAAAKKLAATKAKTDEQKQLVEAAAEVVQAVDEHERVLASRVKLAGGMTKVGELVELDAILKAGFKAPTANLAEEALAESAGRSLMGISKDDYEVWLDLSRRRPVFFPRRTDDGGKKFADELEQYVRRSSNSLEPTQRARELLERFSHAR